MTRILLLLLLLPATAAAEWSLAPEAVLDGGVAVLRWWGATPVAAVARFNGRLIHLSPTPDGVAALLGADLDLAPGAYPLVAVAVDLRGRTELFRATVRVGAAARPEERLTLPPAMVSPADPAVLRRIARERKVLRELFGRRRAAPFPDDFALPVADPAGSPFGLRRVLNGSPRSPHAGVDFRSPRGTSVRAAADGLVVFSGELYYTGGTVILDHGEGLHTLYAHLGSRDCRVGDVLARGAVLGTVGSTGRSTGPHLHWGSKLRGERVDPLALVELLGRKSLDSRKAPLR